MENRETQIRYKVDKEKKQALLRSILPPGAKLIYLCLIDHLGGKSICWPSHKRISKEIGLSERQVGYHLEKLKRMGVLRWRKGGLNPNGTGHTSNTYNLEWILTPYVVPIKKEGQNE